MAHIARKLLYEHIEKLVFTVILAITLWHSANLMLGSGNEVGDLGRRIQSLIMLVTQKQRESEPPGTTHRDHLGELAARHEQTKERPTKIGSPFDPPLVHVRTESLWLGQAASVELDSLRRVAGLRVSDDTMLHAAKGRERGRITIRALKVGAGTVDVWDEDGNRESLRVTVTAKPVIREFLRPPIALSAKAAHGYVDLTWRRDAKTNVTIVGWNVYRADAHTGKTEKIAPSGGPLSLVSAPAAKDVRDDGATETTIRFRDETVAPDTRYRYAVTTVGKLARRKDAVESARCEPVEAATPADVRLSFRGGASDIAVVKVEKWFRDQWVSEMFHVRRGQAIGRPAVVRVDEQRVSIDFSTQQILVDIVEGRRKVVRARWRIEHDPVTREPLRLPDGRPKYRKVRVEQEVVSRKIIVQSTRHGRRELWLDRSSRPRPAPESDEPEAAIARTE